jgi:hypothetical protein
MSFLSAIGGISFTGLSVGEKLAIDRTLRLCQERTRRVSLWPVFKKSTQSSEAILRHAHFEDMQTAHVFATRRTSPLR